MAIRTSCHSDSQSPNEGFVAKKGYIYEGYSFASNHSRQMSMPHFASMRKMRGNEENEGKMRGK